MSVETSEMMGKEARQSITCASKSGTGWSRLRDFRLHLRPHVGIEGRYYDNATGPNSPLYRNQQVDGKHHKLMVFQVTPLLTWLLNACRFAL